MYSSPEIKICVSEAFYLIHKCRVAIFSLLNTSSFGVPRIGAAVAVSDDVGKSNPSIKGSDANLYVDSITYGIELCYINNPEYS